MKKKTEGGKKEHVVSGGEGAKTYMLTPSEGSGYIYVGSEWHVISPGSSLKRPHGKEPRSWSWTHL